MHVFGAETRAIQFHIGSLNSLSTAQTRIMRLKQIRILDRHIARYINALRVLLTCFPFHIKYSLRVLWLNIKHFDPMIRTLGLILQIIIIIMIHKIWYENQVLFFIS